MPLLYESYAPKRQKKRFQIQTKRYPIPWPNKVACGSAVEVVKLHLPSNETTVHRIGLIVEGEFHADGSPITPISCEIVFYVNGTPVISKAYPRIWFPVTHAILEERDVTGFVHEGENDFEIEARQSWDIRGCVSDVHNLSGYIELEYSGPEPPPPEFEEEWWEKALRYGTYGMIAALVIGGVYVGSKLILERRR